jgi:uncharacterized protein (DUF3820 family)
MKIRMKAEGKPPALEAKAGTMPFGKYKGWEFENIPVDYLSWALGNLDFHGKFAWLENELQSAYNEKKVQ